MRINNDKGGGLIIMVGGGVDASKQRVPSNGMRSPITLAIVLISNDPVRLAGNDVLTCENGQ